MTHRRSQRVEARRLTTAQECEDFEQELVDQFLLAGACAGMADGSIADDRWAIFEFVRFLGRPVWTSGPEDADRFLAVQRKVKRLAPSTVQTKACTLAQFFDFLIARYQGDIHALTLSVGSALRYTSTIDKPGLIEHSLRNMRPAPRPEPG